MLPTSPGLNPRPPGHQSDGASNWATEAGVCFWFIYTCCDIRKDIFEVRKSRVQPPPRSATFFRGDWSWNTFYGHSLPSADSRRALVSFRYVWLGKLTARSTWPHWVDWAVKPQYKQTNVFEVNFPDQPAQICCLIRKFALPCNDSISRQWRSWSDIITKTAYIILTPLNPTFI